jgi:hypothetical protein
MPNRVAYNAQPDYLVIKAENKYHLIVHVFMVDADVHLVDFVSFIHDVKIHNKVCIN